MNSESYAELSSNSYAPFAKVVYESDPFLFQKDGASPHASAVAVAALGGNVREGGRYAESAQIPDLSILDFLPSGRHGTGGAGATAREFGRPQDRSLHRMVANWYGGSPKIHTRQLATKAPAVRCR